MRFRLPGWIISIAGVLCLVDAFQIGSGVWNNPLADAWSHAMDSIVLGIIFFIHGLSSRPRRADVVIAACVLTGVNLAGNHGLLSEQNPLWIVLVALAGIVYICGAWIEKRREKSDARSDNDH